MAQVQILVREGGSFISINIIVSLQYSILNKYLWCRIWVSESILSSLVLLSLDLTWNSSIYVFTCICMYVYVCVCMCMCVFVSVCVWTNKNKNARLTLHTATNIFRSRNRPAWHYITEQTLQQPASLLWLPPSRPSSSPSTSIHTTASPVRP